MSFRPDEVVAELHKRFGVDPHGKSWLPSLDDTSAWMTPSQSDALVFDDLAAELARGYNDGRFSFDFCDGVVNALFYVMTVQIPEGPWPDLFWEIFEAFDAGEYHRTPDKSDDPVADWTNPAIADIVSKF